MIAVDFLAWQEDDDEVPCYQLAMLYDQCNYRNRKCAQLKGGTN